MNAYNPVSSAARQAWIDGENDPLELCRIDTEHGVVAQVPACELVGREGTFRLPAGRATYEAVMYDCGRARSDRIRLARIETRDGGLYQVNRYVDWEQPIEVLQLFEYP
jgi:hypothetical protein